MTMLRLFTLLTTLVLLPTSAQALKVMVVDSELQTLGYGETNGNRLNLQLVGNYNGPVVVLFAQTEAEKKAGLFPGLQARYDGTLKNGVLSVLDTSASLNRNGPGLAAPGVAVPLDRFLKTFKLTLGTLPSPLGSPGTSLTVPRAAEQRR